MPHLKKYPCQARLSKRSGRSERGGRQGERSLALHGSIPECPHSWTRSRTMMSTLAVCPMMSLWSSGNVSSRTRTGMRWFVRSRRSRPRTVYCEIENFSSRGHRQRRKAPAPDAKPRRAESDEIDRSRRNRLDQSQCGVEPQALTEHFAAYAAVGDPRPRNDREASRCGLGCPRISARSGAILSGATQHPHCGYRCQQH